MSFVELVHSFKTVKYGSVPFTNLKALNQKLRPWRLQFADYYLINAK